MIEGILIILLMHNKSISGDDCIVVNADSVRVMLSVVQYLRLQNRPAERLVPGFIRIPTKSAHFSNGLYSEEPFKKHGNMVQIEIFQQMWFLIFQATALPVRK